MVFSLSGTVLSKDLFAADGRLVAGRGEIVDLECLRHVSSLAPRGPREHLSRSEALALEDHPLVGALLLASVLGDAPAVHFALLHHTRAGRGYPRVQGTPPLRGLDLVTVASAFSALIAPRSFREQAFS